MMVLASVLLAALLFVTLGALHGMERIYRTEAKALREAEAAVKQARHEAWKQKTIARVATENAAEAASKLDEQRRLTERWRKIVGHMVLVRAQEMHGPRKGHEVRI